MLTATTSHASRDIAALQAENEHLKVEIERLREFAYKDALTGIANRRMFDERFQEDWNRGSRAQSSLALLIVDIDHFKKYNDKHGHQGGDELLKGLGALWLDIQLRSFDLLARYGGEEFAVILPDTKIDGALQVAKRIQQAAYCKGVTVSIGAAAVFPEQSNCTATLIELADKALYQAKAQGRDRITVAEEP